MTTRRMWFACGLALVIAAPGPAGAGEVHLAIKDGRVALVARDATLREILLEWERVGGTRIVNRDRVPGTRLNLDLSDVTEEQALTTLLRPIAGYLASRRLGPEGGSSAFSRIILMPGEASPVTYAASSSQAARPSGPSGAGGPPSGRPGVQRRVLPDGRIVTVMDEPQGTDESEEPNEARPGGNMPGMMRPPFNAPPQGQQEAAGNDAVPPGMQPPGTQPGQVGPSGATAPTVPMTIIKPGALTPLTRPGATPPPPIKPPGD